MTIQQTLMPGSGMRRAICGWLKKAQGLAVESRYPSISEELTKEEYRDALELAARVLFWAESIID